MGYFFEYVLKFLRYFTVLRTFKIDIFQRVLANSTYSVLDSRRVDNQMN